MIVKSYSGFVSVRFFRRFPIPSKYGLYLLTATFLSGASCLMPAVAFAAVADAPAPVSAEQDMFGLPTAEGERTEQPVDLEADQLIHDAGTQTVTATGNVELVQ